MSISSKIISLTDLPSRIAPSSTVALGGAWFSNHPMAAVRQLIRARRHDLRLVSLLASIDVDLMIAAGGLEHLTFGMVSMDALGLPIHFRRAVQAGDLSLTELSSISLQVALDAAGRNVPFLPFSGPSDSDLTARHPDLVGEVTSPFDGTKTMVVKALRVDTAILHASRCDDLGNAQFDGTYGQDPEIARAADQVIVTCEEVVSRAQIAERPELTRIPGFLVTSVVPARFGAHPCSHVPRYAVDAWELLDYQQTAMAGEPGMSEYIEHLRSETEEQYQGRVLGSDRAAVLNALIGAAPVLTVR